MLVLFYVISYPKLLNKNLLYLLYKELNYLLQGDYLTSTFLV